MFKDRQHTQQQTGSQSRQAGKAVSAVSKCTRAVIREVQVSAGSNHNDENPPKVEIESCSYDYNSHHNSQRSQQKQTGRADSEQQTVSSRQ
jgi:hypothetical protein